MSSSPLMAPLSQSTLGADVQVIARVAVALLDPQTVVLAGLRALLEREPNIEVMGVASRLDEALSFDPDPDVIVAETNLQGTRCPVVVERLRDRFRRSAILVFTTVTEASEVEAAFAAGANGYSPKDASASDLVDALRSLHRGERYLAPSLGAVLAWRGHQNIDVAGGGLTAREQDVLRLLAMGHTNLEVAERLGVSPRTAEAHRANLLVKLGVRRRAELVSSALENGYLDRRGCA
jgi:two-component system response regulator NreC